jgi:hypothetical protein
MKLPAMHCPCGTACEFAAAALHSPMQV